MTATNDVLLTSVFTEDAVNGFRMVNAKFPPISLFEDVVDEGHFDDLYDIQSLTNPRLLNEIGNIYLLPKHDIPYGINGCSYVVAPFTHVNPDGSRFSDGTFGLLYIANSPQTAKAEVKYHQDKYWSNVPGLKYERFVFKELVCDFNITDGVDLTTLDINSDIHHPEKYSASRELGLSIKETQRNVTIKYHSVRNTGGTCYALFSPKDVTNVTQAKHFEMVWKGYGITAMNEIS